MTLLYFYNISMEKILNKKDDIKFPKIIFGFDKDWEILNWRETVLKSAVYGLKNGNSWPLGDIPTEVREIIKNNNNKSENMELKALFDFFISDIKNIDITKEETEKAKISWEKISQDYFNALSVMLEIPIECFEKEYLAYFTFSSRCPFHGNAFMFNRFINFNNAAAHEIMHIEFLKKYREYCGQKGLNRDQVSHLKEVLTVLLNTENMKKILKYPDRGYEKHKKIRPEVLSLYSESKKLGSFFIKFLDRVIELVKSEHY